MLAWAAFPGGGGSGGGPANTACSVDADCPEGKYCENGACRGVNVACVADGACLSECTRARLSDPDCTAVSPASAPAGSTSPSPAAATPVVPPSASPTPTPAAEATGEDECSAIEPTRERIRCRMGLIAQGKYGHDYEHEECRAISGAGARLRCNGSYEKTNPCFEFKSNGARFGCVKTVLDLPSSIASGKQKCGGNSSCIEDLRFRVFASVKFRFYNLALNTGPFLKAGVSEGTVLDFITAAEEKKQEFNSAQTTAGRKRIVGEVRELWTGFKQKAASELRQKRAGAEE